MEAPLEMLDLLLHNVRHRRYFEPRLDLFEKREDAEEEEAKILARKIIFL